ncbi:MAG: redoxin domain-containing protein [Verrucomicrobiota bacterium]
MSRTNAWSQFHLARAAAPKGRLLPWLVLLALGAGAAAQTGPSGPGGPPAPELAGNAWLNLTNGGRLSLASRKGKVTVVHFWTFDCINCKHNLPWYRQWRRRFASQGLEVIGIHTPETAAERDPAKVAKKVKELGIDYPVLLDPDRANWDRWQQRYWPAIWLLDKQGRVRYCWEGELEYQGAGGSSKMTDLIRSLLSE